jgi:Holliday junction resolvase RusA-like endonuclease
MVLPTGRAVVFDANPRAKTWKALVAREVRRAYRHTVIPRGMPVAMEVVFFRPRPANHYGSGKNSTTLKRSAPAWPAQMPDTTKLIRGTEDALTGIVWDDDGQVVMQQAIKCYGTASTWLRVGVIESCDDLRSWWMGPAMLQLAAKRLHREQQGLLSVTE